MRSPLRPNSSCTKREPSLDPTPFLILMALTVGSLAGQTAAPSKEYIHLGTRVIAIENPTTTGSGPVRLVAWPATASLGPSQPLQFTAIVTGLTNTAVTWSIAPTNLGSINSASGLYIAPAQITTAQSVIVTAKSVSIQR